VFFFFFQEYHPFFIVGKQFISKTIRNIFFKQIVVV